MGATKECTLLIVGDIPAMGSMRFRFPPGRVTAEMAEQAYLTGFDRIPWEVRPQLNEGELVLVRSCSDSAALHIPWHVEGHGLVTLSTGTLMERDEPYHLPLELARGKLCQLRNQLAEWEMMGVKVPEDVTVKLQEAMRCFSRCVALDHGSAESVAMAEQAIRLTLDSAFQLAASYSQQALGTRRQAADRFPVLLGADLGETVPDERATASFSEAFDTANVPVLWREIEQDQEQYCWDIPDRQIAWCQQNGLQVTAGPLIPLDPLALPDWITLYEEDMETLAALMSQFVQRVVQRYRGRVQLWQCAGRVNTGEVLSLSEEDKVRLTAQAIELVCALDPDTPVLVSFDQPWAEYLGKREMDFPPLHFADFLVRAGLGLSGLVLEINVGYRPYGSMLRDPLEFNRLIEYWGLLGVPLYISLRVPSGSGQDPLARRPVRPAGDGWSIERQKQWVRQYVPLLLSKPIVRGVIWAQLSDAVPHEFPHAGLFDAQGVPKPALGQLAVIRKTLICPAA